MTALDRIFLLGHSQYRFLFLAMARKLRERHGSEIHLYCATEQEADFWNRNNRDGTFASVIAANILYATTERPVANPDAVIARARELEDWLGTTINELAVADRHLGRGYALGGFNHPRSRQSENTSYLQMVAAFVAQIEFWKREFEGKQPTLVVNCDKIAAIIARNSGIPYRTLAGSRYRNLHQWAESEFFDNSRVEQAYEAIRDPEEKGEVSAPYYAHMTLRDVFIRETSFLVVLRKSARLLLQRAYWQFRGYEKARGYFVWSEFSYLWRRRRQIRDVAKLSIPLSDLEGKKFVYYPLHTEPETALQMLSPEYFYQLSCIAALSRDLPAGVTLAVKETFQAIGRRPENFHRQICEFKNVVMLDMMELGLEAARRSEAVATITGTGGFEAAVIGKPVITFGRHNQYNFLPHVRVVEDESKLKDFLREALDPARDGDGALRDGARFLQAVKAVSFDLRGYDYIRLEEFEEQVIEEMSDGLTTSLGTGAAGRPVEVRRQQPRA